MSEPKTLLPYMPLSFDKISSRVFRSFLKNTGRSVVEKLKERNIEMFEPLIHDMFPLDRNRNDAVTKALGNKYEADYIMFFDGDNIWPENTILTLLDHISDEFPVVSGLYFRKTAPYLAVPGHYSKLKENDLKWPVLKHMGMVDDKGGQCAVYKPVQDYDTIQPIDVSGCGVLLVKTDVFQKIDLPYFGYFNSYSLGGEYTIDHLSEDMLFFAKLKRAGIKTLLVPSVRCGHEVTRVIGNPEAPHEAAA